MKNITTRQDQKSKIFPYYNISTWIHNGKTCNNTQYFPLACAITEFFSFPFCCAQLDACMLVCLKSKNTSQKMIRDEWEYVSSSAKNSIQMSAGYSFFCGSEGNCQRMNYVINLCCSFHIFSRFFDDWVEVKSVENFIRIPGNF